MVQRLDKVEDEQVLCGYADENLGRLPSYLYKLGSSHIHASHLQVGMPLSSTVPWTNQRRSQLLPRLSSYIHAGPRGNGDTSGKPAEAVEGLVRLLPRALSFASGAFSTSLRL